MRNKIIFILIVTIVFNGLSNLRELNDLAIVSAMALDINEEGEYEVTAQVLNAKKTSNSASGSESSDDTIITSYTYSGKSIQNAARKIIKECPKKLYLGHMELLIISEKLARENDILDTLDFFIRDNEGGSGFTIVIARDEKASDLVKVLTPLETLPSENILDSISSTEKYRGSSDDSKLSDNLETILSEGKDVTFASIGLEGNLEEGKEEDSLKNTTSKVKIIAQDIAYFRGQRLAGYLNEDDSIIYNLLANRINNALIEINDENGRCVAEILKSKVKLKPEVKEGQIFVDISVDITCNITEMSDSIKINSEEDLIALQDKINRKLEESIRTYINNLKYKYKSDISGFGNLFYKYKNKLYREIKDKFYFEYFENMNVNVNVKTQIPSEGGLHIS